MDETRLAAGDAAYTAGDWTAAAREYLAAAAGEIEGSGYAFHRAGNALMKLQRPEDACAVYERALNDGGYADRPTVQCNMGKAKAAVGAFKEAARAFEAALEAPEYKSRYRALQGAADAYYEMGRIDDAAEGYRQAALDGGNPDPGKALNNLGLCFVALDRPEDAVEAYRAAVDSSGYKGRGRAAGNLGMAYAALGMHDQAVSSFERARGEFGHKFSPSMEAAYLASKAALGEPEHPESRSIGENQIATAPREVPLVEEEDSRFFTITDEEMRVADRDSRRKERAEKTPQHPLWTRIVVWVAVALVVICALVGAYLLGLGYPTQQMTVNGVLEAYADGETVESYWVAVPSTDVDKAMSSLPPKWTSYEIGDVQRSARTSSVDVTVTLEQGGVVTYLISLAREGVGWKVNGVSTSFTSMDGGV
ncbi:MAG: tetratricopeptide repeat protein [Coriobacteriia bacterium]|nr:tetratricopeptide repeat protein [Coriobacteriia bacterium]